MKKEKILCEICARYGIKTEVDGSIERLIETEYSNRKEYFPLCDQCAEQVDNSEDICDIKRDW